MFEVYANDCPTGLTYTGRRARRLAEAAARDLRRFGGRTQFHARRVY